MPAMVPPPASAAQPTGSRIRPPLSRLAIHVGTSTPIGFPIAAAMRIPRVIGDVKAWRRNVAFTTIPALASEERHDDVARPRVKLALEPLVWRDRGLEPESCRTGQVRGRLLPKTAEQVAGPLEITTGNRGGWGEETHGQADHDGIDPGFGESHPCGCAQGSVEKATMDTHAHGQHDRREERKPDDELDRPHAIRIDGCDHKEGHDVVDDRHREHEYPESVRDPLSDQGQHPEQANGICRWTS